MERESFIFYRSFYEAIRCMPPEVQAEIYPAIMEYALFGNAPKKLSKIAEGVFHLVKPNIDVNTARFENGHKGAKYGKRGGRPRKEETPAEADAPALPLGTGYVYDKSFADEVAQMKEDTIWLEQGVCMKFGITACEAHARLDEYLAHLNTECADKPHPSYGDAQRHFCSWLRKVSSYKKRNSEPAPDEEPPLPDYGFNGGFGGTDI